MHKLNRMLVFILVFYISSCSVLDNKQDKPVNLVDEISDAFIKKDVHLFFFFRDNGQEGVFLAASYDGMHFTELNGGRPIFSAPATLGDGLTRDPSVILGTDNRFHMVWTTGWWQGDHFGIAHSEDLLSWSQAKRVPVHTMDPSALNVWAPEIFYDDLNDTYQVMFASTLRSLHDKETSEIAPDGVGAEHRQYVVTTKDFNQWSDTDMFFDQEFSVIDAMIVRRAAHDYIMVIKDETLTPKAEKNLKLVYSKSALGPWTEAGPAITPKGMWIEGPSLNRIGKYWFLYFDDYAKGGYGALRSTDLVEWQDISSDMSFPRGIRHGTILSVPRERVKHLVKGLLEN